jgi:hypothetical protein
MGKHSKIDPLPEPIKPGVFDLSLPPLNPPLVPTAADRVQARRALRFPAKDFRPVAQAPVFEVDHRGDGSRQPAHPVTPDLLAEAWAATSHRDRKRLAHRNPDLASAIVRTLEGAS